MKSRGPKNKEKDWPFNKTLATRRNGQLMLLLQLVPEFQKDIAKLREQYHIPSQGYQLEYDENISPKKLRELNEKVRERVDKKAKSINAYFMPPSFYVDDPRPNSRGRLFQTRIKKLGEKFRLPYNLYSSGFSGIAHYVLWNQILVPSRNWDLQNDPRISSASLPVRWVAIRAYAPLDEHEIKQAIDAMNNALRQNFPKRLAIEKRLHDSDEPKLLEIAELIEQRTIQGLKFPLTWRSRKMFSQASKLAKDLFGYGLPSLRSMRRQVDALSSPKQNRELVT